MPQPTAVPDAQQVLRAPLIGTKDLGGLDPALNADPNSLGVISLLFPGLVTLNSRQQIVPWAADSLPDVSDDGLTYTFRIRTGLKWSDGTPIDANTFAYAINRTLSPCTNSPINYYLSAIKDAATFFSGRCLADGASVRGPVTSLIGHSLIVSDPGTLRIVLGQPASSFLYALSFPTSYAVPRQLIERYGKEWTQHLADDKGFGGSLYMLTSWKQGGTLTLTRNAAFWGVKPVLRQIVYTVYPSRDAAYAAYTAGKQDIGYAPTAQYSKVATLKDFHETAALDVFYYGLNWDMAPFDNALARQAFALAVDKQALATQVLRGTVQATNHIVPEGMPGYNPALRGPDGTTRLTGNAGSARQLADQYAEAKCGGKLQNCPRVTLTIPTNRPDLQAVAQATLAMWKQALPGWPVAVRTLDQNSMVDQLAQRRLQMWLYDWLGDYPDPQDWLSLQFLPGSANNVGNVSLDQATTLLRKADAEEDPSQRMTDYNAAEQLLVVSVAWIPLYQAKIWWQTRPAVKNYAIGSAGLTTPDVWQQVYISTV